MQILAICGLAVLGAIATSQTKATLTPSAGRSTSTLTEALTAGFQHGWTAGAGCALTGAALAIALLRHKATERPSLGRGRTLRRPRHADQARSMNYHDANRDPHIRPREVFQKTGGSASPTRAGTRSPISTPTTPQSATPSPPPKPNCLRAAARFESTSPHSEPSVSPMQARDITIHETTDAEVIVAEFTYHGRAGAHGDQLLRSAVFVRKMRDGQIVQSRDRPRDLDISYPG